MDILIKQVVSQYGFGAAVSFICIGILFYIIKQLMQKNGDFIAVIDRGLASLDKLDSKIEKSQEQNDRVHAFQKDEHDRMFKHLTNIENQR